MKVFLRLAGCSGLTGVGLGVYGAHRMKVHETTEEKQRLFQVAQNYHFLHSIAVLSTPLFSRPVITASLFLGGTTLFCTPLYLNVFRDDTRFRHFAPYGGALLIAGWLSIIFL